MLYDTLKILHILSATLLLTSMVYSYQLWRQAETVNIQRIQIQTWLIILPFAIIQLITGFTIINIQHEDLTQLWIRGSVTGFILVIGSWFAFIYFLLSGQHRRKQAIMLSLCASALCVMIFFMTNKTI